MRGSMLWGREEQPLHLPPASAISEVLRSSWLPLSPASQLRPETPPPGCIFSWEESPSPLKAEAPGEEHKGVFSVEMRFLLLNKY